MIDQIFRYFARAARCSRTRRRLGGLTDEQLRDVGLTRTEAAREAARPFWDYDSYRHSHAARRPVRRGHGCAADGSSGSGGNRT